MKRLRRNTRNSPRPMNAKLKVARKHIPVINVLSAVAMLWAIDELKCGGCSAKYSTMRLLNPQLNQASTRLVADPEKKLRGPLLGLLATVSAELLAAMESPAEAGSANPLALLS